MAKPTPTTTVPADAPEIDRAALFSRLNDVENEIGQTGQLIDVAQRLMSDHFSSNELDPLYAMLRALEHQHKRAEEVMASVWDAHFGRDAA